MRHALLAALALAALPAHAHEFTAGELEVGHPFSLATPASTLGGYLTVTNHGTTPDALVAVEPGAPFGEATLHVTEFSEGGVARMLPVERLEVPAGGTLTLAPSGAHVMFADREGAALEVGDRFPATLLFEGAGRVEVEFVVEPLSFVTDAPDHGAMDHGAMGH
jgi:periplasmic copper chaperone A